VAVHLSTLFSLIVFCTTIGVFEIVLTGFFHQLYFWSLTQH